MKPYLLGAALAASIAMTGAARAAEFTPVEGVPAAILMSGDILASDDAKLSSLLDDRKSKGLETKLLVLSSPGGLVKPAYDMSRIVRDAGIATMVGKDANCASACVLIWAGGVARFYWSTSTIGVHSVSSAQGQEDDGTMATSTAFARTMKQYGAPPAVLGKLVATQPDDMAWLTPADVQGWASNVETAAAQPTPMGYPSLPPPSQPAPPPPPPQPAMQPATLQMDCVSTEKRRPYHVVLAGDRITLYGQTRTTTYPVFEQHSATKETGAWVATGPSRYGQFGAVFGGPSPRMAFVDTKGRTALDQCRF